MNNIYITVTTINQTRNNTMFFKLIVAGLVIAFCTEADSLIEAVNKPFSVRETRHYQPDPPPKNETARMARYIVHYSDWCALAHISRHGNTTGFPVARVYSTADGFFDTTTGTPYFYVSKMDAHINDLVTDGRCSVTMSLAEGDYCRKQSLDPEDPRCAQVILTGKFIFLDTGSKDWQKGKAYLFQRHPIMSSWPEGHHWQVGKLKIGQIQVADNFGGSAYPSVKEYFDAQP